MTHPTYAILDGRLHRQDIPGGDWTLLDEHEVRHLLSFLTGLHLTDEWSTINIDVWAEERHA